MNRQYIIRSLHLALIFIIACALRFLQLHHEPITVWNYLISALVPVVFYLTALFLYRNHGMGIYVATWYMAFHPLLFMQPTTLITIAPLQIIILGASSLVFAALHFLQPTARYEASLYFAPDYYGTDYLQLSESLESGMPWLSISTCHSLYLLAVCFCFVFCLYLLQTAALLGLPTLLIMLGWSLIAMVQMARGLWTGQTICRETYVLPLLAIGLATGCAYGLTQVVWHLEPLLILASIPSLSKF